MPKVDYSKDQPERFLRWIENQEKQIKDVSNQLVDLLSNIGGVDESMIEDIKAKVGKCLQTRKRSEQELDAKKIRETFDELESLHNQYKDSYNKPKEQLDENQKISQEINEFCENFKRRIEWISDIDRMIILMKSLLENNELVIKPNDTWKEIMLDCLDYEIKILDIWSCSDEYRFSEKLLSRQSVMNPKNIYKETDKEWMDKISSNCSQWRKVPSQKDIQNILKSLSDNYSLISGRQWDIHDEDIAFFMLMTQSDGEFLLKKDRPLWKNRVLKCYHDFRWFKDMRFNSTGQIMLVREKK